MRASTFWLRSSYTSAFQTYLLDRGEATLRSAYELGREAVSREMNVLDLAVVHHEALLSALGSASEDAEEITRRGGEFFLESLSAFEMVQRGLREAREAALVEKRHAAMLRRLSTLLGDASLALDASESVEEMLRLVAEHARELTSADTCVATAALERGPRRIDVGLKSEPEAGAGRSPKDARLSTIPRVVRSAGAGSIDDEEAADSGRGAEAGIAPDTGRSARLAAPLTALDGRELGSIELVSKRGAGFNEVDEAVLGHLAQMASAAIERADLYQRESPDRLS